MATITTSTQAASIAWPVNTLIEVQPGTTTLWAIARVASNGYGLFKSTDLGLSWSAQGTHFPSSGFYDVADMRIDSSGQQIFLVFLTNDGTKDNMYFKRIDIQGATPVFGGDFLLGSGGSGSVRSYWYSASIAPVKNPDNTYAIIVAGCFRGAGGSGVLCHGVSIKNDPGMTTYRNDGIMQTTKKYYLTGDDTALTCSIDVEHNGDGFTASTPNIWFAFQIHDKAWVMKFTWKGYKTGWGTPTGATSLGTGRVTARDIPGRWDGERFVIISTRPSDLTRFDVWERNRANTSTVTRTTPAHPVGNVQSAAVTFNHVTKDLRIYAAGPGSPTALYYVDYIRATNTWGSWTASGASPIASEWSLRRGTFGTNQYDLIYQTGASSPYTISNLVNAVNFAPTAPTWITGTAGTVSTNGAAFDVSSSLLLDWTFNDPNSTDTQSAYAVSRQIGAGTVQWWRASDSTWQLSEVQNTSGTTQLTLTTGQWLGAGGATDPAHVYKVKTWDAAGLPSPAYSAALSVIPSTRVDPTLVAPTAAQILNTGLVTVDWTVTEQSAYRVKVVNTVSSEVVYDSGFQTDPGGATPTITDLVVPKVLPDGFAGQVQLTTKNIEGLSSVLRTVNFTVDFVEPVTPTVTGLTATPSAGGITVTLTQPAATGTQPLTSRMDLWRRKAVAGTTTPTNANPYFETNTTDWTATGFASAVRSTAFAHSGVASYLLTPNGVAAAPKVQMNTSSAGAAGTPWEFRIWFRATTANKPVRVILDWYAGGVYQSSTSRDMTPVAGVWVYGWVSGVVPFGSDGVRGGVEVRNTPAAGDTVYLDELGLFRGNSDEGIRIVSGADSGTAYVDWRAVAGVEYEYRGTAEGVNGTDTRGPWLT